MTYTIELTSDEIRLILKGFIAASTLGVFSKDELDVGANIAEKMLATKVGDAAAREIRQGILGERPSTDE